MRSRKYSFPRLATLGATRHFHHGLPSSAFDGHERAPVPRFTTLTASDRAALASFFSRWAAVLLPALVPGAHVMIASNPFVSPLVTQAVAAGGFERAIAVGYESVGVESSREFVDVAVSAILRPAALGLTTEKNATAAAA